LVLVRDQFPLEAREPNYSMTLINESSALDALGGDKNLLIELAKMFVEDAPIALATLRKAMESENSRAVLSEVHMLKGLVSTFFAKEVVEQARRLEEAAAIGNLTLLSNGGFRELRRSIEAMILDFQSLGWVDPHLNEVV
jgi:HPt (histidine-containing phosphotransfer) domain-containing protein